MVVLGPVGGKCYVGTGIAAINDGYCVMIVGLVWSGYHGERLDIWILIVMRAIFYFDQGRAIKAMKKCELYLR